jgi:succinylarginine dihydrolase
MVFEANFDGLVGPTHNYSGLAAGNLASQTHVRKPSNPQEAALQGLLKMRFLATQGIVQGVLPPRERPNLPVLRSLGFRGSDEEIVTQAASENPRLLHTVSSASSMWAANAATVCPSSDAMDHRVHITPANLVSHFHRSLESEETQRIMRGVFPDPAKFCVHHPLPSHPYLGDEGAANHMRLCPSHAAPGVHVFAYGFEAFSEGGRRPGKYPARQAFEASRAVARLHQLPAERLIFAQQNPEAIDQGAFHTDVLAVGNENLLFIHEEACLDQASVLDEIRRKSKDSVTIVEVSSKELPVPDAVQSYLFNSQIVTLPQGGMIVIVPMECEAFNSVQSVLERLKGSFPAIHSVHSSNLRQSMQNGGGPACLRLRMVLNDEELAAVNQHCLLEESLYARLVSWVNRHYRDRLEPDDLSDPALVRQSFAALDELASMLHLGSLYSFQR